MRISDPELIQKLRERIASTKQPVSAYIRELIERDLAGSTPTVTNPNCMIELAKEFAPFLGDDIAKLVAGQDQKKILASILISYAGGDYSDPNSMQLSPEFKKALKREGFAK